MSWIIAETNSNYRIGLEQIITEDIIQYGFEIRGNKVYIISNGYTETDLLTTIKEGDVLGVSVINRQIQYYINGEVVNNETTWTIRTWRFCIKYGNGETHITNFMINGKPVEYFTTSGSVQIEKPKTNSINLTIHVEANVTAVSLTVQKKQTTSKALIFKTTIPQTRNKTYSLSKKKATLQEYIMQH